MRSNLAYIFLLITSCNYNTQSISNRVEVRLDSIGFLQNINSHRGLFLSAFVSFTNSTDSLIKLNTQSTLIINCSKLNNKCKCIYPPVDSGFVLLNSYYFDYAFNHDLKLKKDTTYQFIFRQSVSKTFNCLSICAKELLTSKIILCDTMNSKMPFQVIIDSKTKIVENMHATVF
jgi:hypothetical protein